MLRLIAKWYISRSIDCDRELPGWVERRVGCDPSLKHFYNQSQRLAARLQSAEPQYESELARNVEAAKPLQGASLRSNHVTIRFAAIAVGLAAIAFLTIVPFLNRSHSGNNESDSVALKPESGLNAKPFDTKRVDPAALRELLASGRAMVERLKQEPDRITESALNRDFEQLAAITDLDVEQVIQPVSDLGTSYGALLSKLDQQAETENRRIISGGVGAWNFFVHKLPQSAASLAGL